MTTLTYPYTLTAGAPENVNQLNSNLTAISSVINGGITNGNLSGSAGITDANLASPNNSVYKTIYRAEGFVSAGNPGGLAYYFLGNTITLFPSGGGTLLQAYVPPVLVMDSADYAVAGKSTVMRIRAAYASNGTAIGVNVSTALTTYTVGGAGTAMTYTIGSGTGIVTLTTPAANSTTVGTTSDLSLPSNGNYLAYIYLSGSPAANHVGHLSVQVQVRNV